MELVGLHSAWDRMPETIRLLNEEWPRSEYSRTISLERSRPQLPASLLLLGNDRLIGHSKLCDIPGSPQECWIESVVIWRHLRGQGFGAILMAETEREARGRGFISAILSTHDKQAFYQRCGYSFCQPVCVVGAAGKLLEGARFANFIQKLQPSPNPSFQDSSSTEDATRNLERPSTERRIVPEPSSTEQCSGAKKPPPIPPPPPSTDPCSGTRIPPPPPPLRRPEIVKLDPGTGPVQFMRKDISV